MAARLCGVRPFPHVLAKIRVIASDPTRSVADLATVVESDVAFAARLLRVVNSAAMGLGRKCTSIRHAVALLGTRGVANLATAVAALAFVDDASASAPDIGRHAVGTAGIARMIGSLAGVSPEEAFTAGLLHDVGMLMLLQSNESFYEELIDQVGDSGEPSVDEERALLGFDHAELGGHVLSSWNVPAPLPDVVMLHHDWEAAAEVGGTIMTMVAVVRVADILWPRLEKYDEPTEEDLELLRAEPAVECLGISPEELIRMWASFKQASAGGWTHGEGGPSMGDADDGVHDTRSSSTRIRASSPGGLVSPRRSNGVGVGASGAHAGGSPQANRFPKGPAAVPFRGGDSVTLAESDGPNRSLFIIIGVVVAILGVAAAIFLFR